MADCPSTKSVSYHIYAYSRELSFDTDNHCVKQLAERNKSQGISENQPGKVRPNKNTFQKALLTFRPCLLESVTSKKVLSSESLTIRSFSRMSSCSATVLEDRLETKDDRSCVHVNFDALC